MEKSKKVVVDGTHNNLLSSLSSCLHQRNQVQPYDIINQDNPKQRQWPESIDPLQLVLGKVIGRGSYSVVHMGSYHGQTVAVKVMDCGDEGLTNEIMERMKNYFIREVGIWQNLDHPNITKMIGVTMSMKTSSRHMNKITKNESNFCAVSEYVRGSTLEYYLFKKRYKKLPMKTVVRFALDLAKGLSYLHSKKIVHRDVKPENILIDKQHILKLADFGESSFEEDIFWEGEEPGTHYYTAPEVISKNKYGHKCDVYAFGICLWEIYCCEKAHKSDFADKLTAELYNHTKPNRPLNCPMWLTRLMEQCWDTDPRKRPEMKEVVVQLEEIVKSEGWQTMSEDQQGAFGCFGSFMHGR